jgi:hypothetical protein
MRAARQRSLAAIGISLLGLMVCVGCGSSQTTIEGNVTFDGKPIEQGSIVFEPADRAGSVAGGTIEQGKYRVSLEAGAGPGKKIVRISAVGPTGRKIEAGPPSPPGQMIDEVSQYIPAVYNDKSTLTVDVAAGRTTQDFELRSQPSSR